MLQVVHGFIQHRKALGSTVFSSNLITVNNDYNTHTTHVPTHTGIAVCATLATLLLILLSVIGLLLALMLKRKFQTNNKVGGSETAMTPKQIVVARVDVTDVICKPNVAHDLSASFTSDYLYIVPP